MEQTAEQLEQFIALLRDTGTHVLEGMGQVEADTAGLERLGGDLAEQWGGFGHDLQGLQSDLEASGDAALAELEGAAGFAHAAADTRLPAALDHIQHAETGLAQATQAGKTGLDHDGATLHDQGFQPLSTTLTSLEGEMDTSRTETEAAFAGLEGALESLKTELHSASAQAEQALDAAAAALGQEDKHALESEAQECGAGFHELGPELDGECTAVGDEMRQLYDGWGEEVEREGQDLVDTVHSLFQGASEEVRSLGTEHVEEPADRVTGEAIPPLDEELQEQVAMLEAAQGVAAELPPLVADLQVAERVIDRIDELLKTMDH